MRSQGFWDKGSAISIAAGILRQVARFSGGSTVPTQMPTQIRQMPTYLYATYCNFGGFWEAIGYQMWDIRLHLG